MKMEQPLTVEPIMLLQDGSGFLLLKEEMPTPKPCSASSMRRAKASLKNMPLR
jgi:hypothetical protein